MNFISLLVFVTSFFVLIFSAKGATVSSAMTEVTPISFGNIDPISGGTITNCTALGPKILSGCTNGSFSVSANESVGNNSRTIIVFISSSDSSLTASGGSANVSFSLSSGSTGVTSQTYEISGTSGTVIIPVYGSITLGNVVSQPSGLYSGNYTLTACGCDNDGCATSEADPKC